MGNQLIDFLVDNEPSFRKARLPALYSDFRPQRTLNPDGYSANLSAWRRALALITRSGLLPTTSGSSPQQKSSSLVLGLDNCGETLLRALESKQYGRPLALGTVIREAIEGGDLVELEEFKTRGIDRGRHKWTLWKVALWAARSLLGGSFGEEALPTGRFVVVANVEDTARRLEEAVLGEMGEAGTRYERTFSRAHFCRTWGCRLAGDGEAGARLSEEDMDLLLRHVAREKGVALYDGEMVRIRTPGGDANGEGSVLTVEDAALAQTKDMLAQVAHQSNLLSARIETLQAEACAAARRQNTAAARAALVAKKKTEALFVERDRMRHQLEDTVARLQKAADNVAMVRAAEAAGSVLKQLNAEIGGAEGVAEMMERVRRQEDEADEIAQLLREADEEAVEAELDRMDRVRGAEGGKQAEDTRTRLEAVAKTPSSIQPAEETEVHDEVADAIQGMEHMLLAEKP